jgi:hypothetical protein
LRLPPPLTIGWAALLLYFLGPGCALAQSDSRAQEVKAAFVLNIARFVYWPDEAFDPHPGEIHLCLYRGNPLGGALETIRDKRVAGKTLVVVPIDAMTETDHCNVLLVPADQLEHYRRELAEQADAPLLTITDGTQDAATDTRGIQITLARRDTRIGFDIDQRLVQRSGLRLSSQLLKLGRIVGGAP